MCQFVLFRWDTSAILSNFSSVPITPRASLAGAWVTCLWIPSHWLPLNWKKKCRLPKVNLFMSSNHIFFHFPLSFLPPHLKKGSYAFQGLTCHSPLDFESIPVLLPQTLHPSTLTFLSDHSFYVYLPQTQAMIAWLSLFNSLKDWANEATYNSSSAMYFSNFWHSGCHPYCATETDLQAHKWAGGWTWAVSQTRSCNRSAALDGTEYPLLLSVLLPFATIIFHFSGHSCSISCNNFALAWPYLNVKSSLKAICSKSSLNIVSRFLETATLSNMT